MLFPKAKSVGGLGAIFAQHKKELSMQTLTNFENQLLKRLCSRLLVSIGKNKAGEDIYSLKPMAALFNTTVDELVKEAEQIPGVQIFYVTPQGKRAHLARTLNQLKPDIDNGKLAIKYILKKYNQSCKPELRIKTSRTLAGIPRGY